MFSAINGNVLFDISNNIELIQKTFIDLKAILSKISACKINLNMQTVPLSGSNNFNNHSDKFS